MESKSKKWRLWRSSYGDLESSWKGSKGNHIVTFEGSDSPPVAYAFAAIVAIMVHATPKDFRAVRQEWVAI